MVHPVGCRLSHDGTALRPTEFRQDRGIFAPVDEVGRGGQTQTSGAPVIAGVGKVEGPIDANEPGILGASRLLPWLRGIDDRLRQTSEVDAVMGPGQANRRGEMGVLGAKEKENCVIHHGGGRVIDVVRPVRVRPQDGVVKVFPEG